MLDDMMPEFRSALSEQIAQPEEPLEPFSNALVTLAASARARAIPCEQFVILIKRQWDLLAETGLDRVSDPSHTSGCGDP